MDVDTIAHVLELDADDRAVCGIVHETRIVEALRALAMARMVRLRLAASILANIQASSSAGRSDVPRTVSASEAKNKLGDVMAWAVEHKDEVIVERHGEPSVVIVPFDEYERLRALREEERRRDALDRLRKLREASLTRNRDLSPAEGDALAERFSRELVEDLAESGTIQIEREQR